MELLSPVLDALARLGELLKIDSADVLRTGGKLLGIWVMIWIGWRVVIIGARHIERSVDDGDDSVTTLAEKRGKTVSQLLRSVGKVVLLTLGLMLSLNVFINIGPLLAGAGVLGLAVSFGAQSMVKDVISGFFLLLEDQLAVGDIVEAGGKGGVVEKLTLRVLQLRDVEGVLHTIPCGEIAIVSNKTRVWSRAVVEIGVAYGEEVDRALEVFRSEAGSMTRDANFGPMLDGEPEVWGVESLADSAVVIRTVLRTRPGDQWNVAREFRRRMKNRLDAEGIEIPFPQRTTWLRVDDDRIARAIAPAAKP